MNSPKLAFMIAMVSSSLGMFLSHRLNRTFSFYLNVVVFVTAMMLLASCGKLRPTAIQGPQGERGEMGEAGRDGTNGETGEKGDRGDKGDVGETGPVGPAGIAAVVEVIDPCGQQTVHDEVLLRLSDGHLYALYYAPPYSFLTKLNPGAYSTTDGTGCQFTINIEEQLE